jgi:Fur family ferric uptake transcriptional regulator
MMSETGLSDLTSRWIDKLQENGYRLTDPRRAVVETMANSRYVLSPMEVHQQACKLHKKLGLVTVYRTLEKLEQLQLIQRVHRPSDCQAFVASPPGHKHLLICECCGRVDYFNGDPAAMEQFIAKVGSRSGYRVKNHWLQLFGRCTACQEKTSS